MLVSDPVGRQLCRRLQHFEEFFVYNTYNRTTGKAADDLVLSDGEHIVVGSCRLELAKHFSHCMSVHHNK